MNENKARRGFTLVELMVTTAIIGVLASIAIVGYVKWIDTAKLSKAETFLATVRTQQLAYKSRFGIFLTAPVNPSGSVPASRTFAPWETQSEWVQLGANPGRDTVEFQYETGSGTGTCVPKSGVNPTCSGISNKKWFWVTAESADWVLIANSARPNVWKIEK